MLPCPGPSLSAHARPPMPLRHGAHDVTVPVRCLSRACERSGNPVKALEDSLQFVLRMPVPGPYAHIDERLSSTCRLHNYYLQSVRNI